MPTRGMTGWLAPVRRPSCHLLDLPGGHPTGDPVTCWRIEHAGPKTLMFLLLARPGGSSLDDPSILLARAGPETLKLLYPRDPDASHLAIEYF